MSYRDFGWLKVLLFATAMFFVGGTTAYAGAPNISYAQYGSLAEVKMGDSVTLLCQSFCDYGPAIYFDGLSEKLTIPDSWTATQVVFRVPGTVSVGSHTLKVKLRDTGEVSANDLAIKVMAAPDTPIISSISPSTVYNSGYSGSNPGTGTNYDEVKLTGTFGPNSYLILSGVGWENPDIAYQSIGPTSITFGLKPSAVKSVYRVQVGNKTGGSNPIILPPSNEVLLTVIDGSKRAPEWHKNANFDNAYGVIYAGKATERIDMIARYVNEADAKVTVDGVRIPATFKKDPAYESTYTIGFVLPATLSVGTHTLAIESISGTKAKSEPRLFTVQPLPSWMDPDPGVPVNPDPSITLTADETSTTLSKIVTIKVSIKNTVENSSWKYVAPGTASGNVHCSSVSTGSGLEIRCMAYEPGGTSLYAELTNNGKTYRSNTLNLSWIQAPTTVSQTNPELNLTGVINGVYSPYTINMKVGETLVVQGAPKNIKQGFTLKITPKFQGLCSTNLSDNRVWLFTCKPTSQMSEFFYVEIIQEGKTYTSNLLKVNVGPVVIEGDTLPYLYVMAEANGIMSPLSLRIRPGTRFVLTGNTRNLLAGSAPYFSWTNLVASHCITGKPSDSVWTLTCTASMGDNQTGIGDFVLKDGKGNYSNSIHVIVDQTVSEINSTVKNVEKGSQQEMLDKIAYLQAEIQKQKSVVNQNSNVVPEVDVDTPYRVGCTNIGRTLKLKSANTSTKNDVTSLQSYLAEKGYLKASPSGYYGTLTAKAVTAFQKANGIQATGIVGPVTRVKIKNLTCN